MAREQELFQNRIAIILGIGTIFMAHSDNGIGATWRVVNVSAGGTLSNPRTPQSKVQFIRAVLFEGHA
jgi:hypothetical protein